MAETSTSAVEKAWQHIHHLSVRIGSRPSTGVAERAAAEYAAETMRQFGATNVRLEAFRSPRSTYAPYRAIFLVALVAQWLGRRGRGGAVAAACVYGLAALGFYGQTDLARGWPTRVTRHGSSQNTIGVIPAAKETRGRIVVYGHVDTHRTPLLYSSPLMLRIFSPLLAAGFVSLIVDALRFGVRALAQPTNRTPRWAQVIDGMVGGVTALLQGFGLWSSVQADWTPYAPGANDNASGAGMALALGERLAATPLCHTEVWVVATGCEELGSHGMRALLEKHGAELQNAWLIGFDMVGVGNPAFIPVQGLLRHRRADPELLAACRMVAASNPQWHGVEHAIDAYDDSYMVAKLGFRGITIDAEGTPGNPVDKHWHRPSDTIEHISRDSLAKVEQFAWALLQHLDRR